MAATLTSAPLYVWARARRVLIESTAATPVLVVPVLGTNLDALCTGVITNPTPNSVSVLVTVTWQDPDVGALTLDWVGGTYVPNSQTVTATVAARDALSLAPVPVLAAAGSLITITVTAGTAGALRATFTVYGEGDG
jgi:hypothetical protein